MNWIIEYKENGVAKEAIIFNTNSAAEAKKTFKKTTGQNHESSVRLYTANKKQK